LKFSNLASFILISTSLIFTFPIHSYSDIDKTLRELEERQEVIETWESDFIQTKVLSIMTTKIISKGHIYFKRPNLIHWRYTKGGNLLMVFDGKEAWLYYPNLKEAERYRDIEDIISRFPLASGLDLKNLGRYWDIRPLPSPKEGIVALELRPKVKEEKGHPLNQVHRISGFDRMILWIEGKRGLPLRVEISEPKGDSTIIEFKGMRVNERFRSDIFTFKPEAGVKVITPLEQR